MKKLQVKHICFDLDGTLINSYPTIYKAAIKTLKELKINSSIEEPEFRRRIGYHFTDIFKELKIPVADIEHFITLYRGFYFDFIDESEFYPGVTEVLEKLNKEDIIVSLLTTKIQEQAEKIIEHFLLKKYFSYIMGRRSNMPYKPSPEPLIYICKELGALPSETLMVGDTELDIRCGKDSGAKTCAVLYGYRDKESLEREYPDFLIKNLEELLEIIID